MIITRTKQNTGPFPLPGQVRVGRGRLRNIPDAPNRLQKGLHLNRDPTRRRSPPFRG